MAPWSPIITRHSSSEAFFPRGRRIPRNLCGFACLKTLPRGGECWLRLGRGIIGKDDGNGLDGDALGDVKIRRVLVVVAPNFLVADRGLTRNLKIVEAGRSRGSA